jgi:OmpA-OmpF porin, OOP family
MRNAIPLLISLALSALALPASAQLSPWYVGAAFGESKTDDALVSDREGTIRDSGEATNVRSSFDDKGGTGKLWAGYRINDRFAVEGHYTDLGKTSIETRFNVPRGFTGVAAAFTEREVKGFGIDFVANVPVWHRLSLYGKVGYFRSDVKTDVRLEGDAHFADNEPGNTRNERSRENNFKYGVGLQWAFGERVSARLEWERVNAVGKPATLTADNPTLQANVDAWWLGVQWRF